MDPSDLLSMSDLVEKMRKLCCERDILHMDGGYGLAGSAIRQRVIDVWRTIYVQQKDVHEVFDGVLIPETDELCQQYQCPVSQCTECRAMVDVVEYIRVLTRGTVYTGSSLDQIAKKLATDNIQCPACNTGTLTDPLYFTLLMRTTHGLSLDMVDSEAQDPNDDDPTLYKTAPTSVMQRQMIDMEKQKEPLESNAATMVHVECGVDVLRPELGMGLMKRLNPTHCQTLAQVGTVYRNVPPYPQALSPLLEMRESTEMVLLEMWDPQRVRTASWPFSVRLLAPKLKRRADQYLNCNPSPISRAFHAQNVPVVTAVAQLCEYLSRLFRLDAIVVREYMNCERNVRRYVSQYGVEVTLPDHALPIEISTIRCHAVAWANVAAVVETTVAVDRLVYATLALAVQHDASRPWTWLQLPAIVAPWHVVILVTEDDDTVMAAMVQNQLQRCGNLGVTIFHVDMSIQGHKLADQMGIPVTICLKRQPGHDDALMLRVRNTNECLEATSAAEAAVTIAQLKVFNKTSLK